MVFFYLQFATKNIYIKKLEENHNKTCYIGPCWRGLPGGGALFGPADWSGGLSGEEVGPREIILPYLLLQVTYLYPCLSLGLRGCFSSSEHLLWGRRVEVTRAWTAGEAASPPDRCRAGGHLGLEFSSPRPGVPTFRHWPSTEDRMAELPHTWDPYEQKTVSCKKSRWGRRGAHSLAEWESGRGCS